MKRTRLSPRIWTCLALVGLVGQLAWVLENMYFNVFLYNTISTDPYYISAMVAASAATATVTTLLIGALSDRVGKRKAFICGGYILWGLSTAAFGLVTVENAARMFPAASAVSAAAMMVIILDCVMTLFGSTANDAAFNAYVTDVTDDTNRGRAESMLAVLPLVAMLVVFGLCNGMTQRGEWQKFFAIFGILVTATGVVSIFLIKEPTLKPRRGSYLKNLAYGFRPSVVRENPSLYLSLCALGLFNIAIQVFYPYLIIYIQNYLGFDDYAIILGVALVGASIVSLALGGVIDRVGKLRFIWPAAGVMLVGLVSMYFARGMAFVAVAGLVMMSGNLLVTAVLSAKVRDHTPEGKAGHFQGIRMIFAVLLPMVIGPFIGAAVIRNSDSTYIELGVEKTVPTPEVFLAAAVILLMVMAPVIFLKRRDRI